MPSFLSFGIDMSKDMPSAESLKIWHPSAALDHGLGGNHGFNPHISQTIREICDNCLPI